MSLFSKKKQSQESAEENAAQTQKGSAPAKDNWIASNMAAIEKRESRGKLDKLEKPKLLLHACCGPCATYPLEKIAEDYEIKVLFYNPNITDIHEYNLRRQNLEYFLKNRKNTYPWDDEIHMFDEVYDPNKFYETIKTYEGYEDEPEGGARCKICIAFRMEAAAIAAEEYHFDYFTTTLSVSPHKDSKWIKEVGEGLEEKYNVKYLDENFKKNNGYARSREISIEYRLYRQDYCGCEFSKRDMELKREKQEQEERNEQARLAEENKLKEADVNPADNEFGDEAL